MSVVFRGAMSPDIAMRLSNEWKPGEGFSVIPFTKGKGPVPHTNKSGRASSRKVRRAAARLLAKQATL